METKTSNLEETSVVGGVVQPHDTRVEGSVLATIMRNPTLYNANADLINADMFYRTDHQAIYRCVSGVIDGGGIADINSLYNYAVSHEVGYKLDRYDFVRIFQLSSTATFEQDIKILNKLSKKRQVWYQLQLAAQKSVNALEDIDQVVNGVIEVLSSIQTDTDDNGIASFGDALEELKKMVDDNMNNIKSYIATGYRIFDDFYVLRPDTMTVIAAFTSVGKSSLAMDIALGAAKSGVPTAYYSLEMGKAELAARGISRDAQIPASLLMNKKLDESGLANFRNAKKWNEDLPIFIDERSTVDFDKTVRSIRTMVKTKGVKLAIIDYLQIYSQVGDSTESSLAYMARAAKNVAKELGIAVIVLSQLHRGADHPVINMLRGSGQIEESADNIVLIDRPEAYPDSNVNSYKGSFSDADIHGTAKLILAKGRGIGTGAELVGFNGTYTHFFELPDTPLFRNNNNRQNKDDENIPF